MGRRHFVPILLSRRPVKGFAVISNGTTYRSVMYAIHPFTSVTDFLAFTGGSLRQLCGGTLGAWFTVGLLSECLRILSGGDIIQTPGGIMCSFSAENKEHDGSQER